MRVLAVRIIKVAASNDSTGIIQPITKKSHLGIADCAEYTRHCTGHSDGFACAWTGQ